MTLQPQQLPTDHPPVKSGGVGLLVVNLGTPDAPDPRSVKRYLAEFLSDRRVVSLPPLLWQPLLRGVILPLRAPKVAPKYASVWLDGGSPLAVYTRQLAAAMQQELPDLQVLDAMRYGEPSLARLLQRLRDEGLQRVLVLPLYPQYSTTTTASVGDVVARADGLALRMVDEYHLDDGWVAAVAQSVRDHRAANGAGEHLLFSFHGLPQRVADAGDPYPRPAHSDRVPDPRGLCQPGPAVFPRSTAARALCLPAPRRAGRA